MASLSKYVKKAFQETSNRKHLAPAMLLVAFVFLLLNVFDASLAHGQMSGSSSPGGTLQAAPPTFSPIVGSYSNTQTVSIRDTTPGATIYYTIDSTAPSTGSQLYTTPIVVSTTETINAIAVAPGYTNSQIASSTYTIGGASPAINYLNGFTTGNINLYGATIGNGILQLTDGGSGEARVGWFETPVNVQAFTTDFTFQELQAQGDGFTFTLQNAPAQIYAVGGPGGGLGYNSITPSVAVKFDIYKLVNGNTNSVGFFTNGAIPGTPATDLTPSGIILSSGDVMHAHITYDGSTLTLTLTDTITGAVFTTSQALNLPSILGGNTAYAGFTGGTGAATAVQDILTWTYVVGAPTPTVATPTLTPAPGTYASAQTVTIADSTVGSTIYYTTNGQNPTVGSTLYTGPITVGASETVKAIAVAAGLSNSGLGTSTYTIGTQIAATPVFSVPGGSYTAAQTVTISDSTTGASIYYTTNGSTPTGASNLYSGPITVSATETLNAIAVAPGYSTSAVATAAYTITGAASAPVFSPAGGSYAVAQSVTISDTTPGALIYYTLDGSAPSSASTLYSGPISVATNETISAIAVAPGYSTSAVSTATYSFNASLPVVNYASGFTSTGINLYGATITSNNALQLTDGGSGEAHVGWYETPVNVQAFTTDFTFQETSAQGNGFTFTLQNAPAQIYAVGGSGSGLGYSTITPSFAVKFDLYTPVNGNTNSVGFFTNGTLPTTPATDLTPSGVILSNGDVMRAHITYDGTTLTLTLTDTTTGATFTASQALNLPTILGANTAYAGFTGGTGASTSIQNILTWTYVVGLPTQTVATPTFSPAAGTYATSQTVTISDSTANATIYYTTNGQTPTTSSTQYSGPITVGSSETVSAIAVVGGSTSSGVGSAAYVIGTPAATPVFSIASGSYTTTQTVSISDATNGAAIYYTTNGSTPTTSSAQYAGPITVSSTETINAIAVAPGYSNSPIATAAYTILPLAATPVFSPIAGSYATAQTVSISDSTTGASIYYTTNGSVPTAASTPYNGPITVSATETLNAIAIATGFTNSAVGTAAYTINGSLPAPIISPAAGTYTSAQTVTISDANVSASIYYTTNGSTPTTSSALYTGPITVNANETVTAIAVAQGFSYSTPSSAAYVIAVPAAAPNFSPAGGTYLTSQTVTIASTTPGAAIYYTTNGAAPTTASTLYTGPITVSASETISAIVVASGFSNSTVASAAYVIQVPAAAPTFSPSGGTFSTAQSVTIASTTPGAAIYYTTNGSAPSSASTLYSGPITVSTSETINAIAVAANYANSAVSSAAYQIGGSSAINFASGFTTTNINLYGASIANGVLELTDGGSGEAHVGWFKTPVNVQAFTTDFTFQEVSAIGNGFTFTLQNAPAQIWAVGTSGSGLGYSTITPSVAVKFDLHTPVGTGTNSTGFYTNGAAPTTPALDLTPSGIQLNSGHVLRAHITYDGTTLTLTLTDTTTGAVFTNSQTLNLPSILGGNTAFAGFTGGTGATTSIQNILTWTYVVGPPTATATAPTFSPAAGTFSSAQTVTISDSTVGAAIYYTTNGTTPTTSSTLFTGPIAVTASETINAIAAASGSNNSPVASAAYTIANSTATPVFSVVGGTYTTAQTVSLSDATAGASIYYTTNGATPSASSTPYTGPISVSSSETLSAIAISVGSSSSVATASYVIAPLAGTPQISPAAGTYAISQTVSITDSTPGVSIYYTTDGSTPTASSTLYTGPITVGSTETINAIAVETGYTSSSIATAAYTIGQTAPVINYANGFTSTGLSLYQAVISKGALEITDGGTNEAHTAWFTTPVNIQQFTTDFTFQETAAVANGFTFTFQNSSQGIFAVGGSGSGLGYSSITPSVAVKFDLFTPVGAGTDSVGFYGDGTTPTTPAFDLTPSGVLLNSGDIMRAHLTYDGTTLTLTLTDTVTGASYVASQVGNLPGIVNGNTAYVGFTGGTGTSTAVQNILTWTYVVGPPTPTVAQPTFTPAAGSYTTAQSVTISDATPGATIYYTTNGSVPSTSSTQYTGPITVSSSETLNAMAVLSQYNNSQMASGAYLISSSLTSQTISFPTIQSQVDGIVLTLNATASSGLAVTFSSSTPAVCLVTGGTASLLSNGTCTITASQPGNSTYASATPVTQSFSVGALSQTITFPAIAAQTVGATFTLTATASSNLAVTFASSTPAVCTVSGSTATMVSPGTCTIVASQAGNSGYAAATPVSQSFSVTGAVLSAPVFSPAAGTYTTAQTVTITDATAGATIYYTTNGATPSTASNVYTGPITVSASETLSAIAVASGSTSPVGSAAYTITPASAAATVVNLAAVYNVSGIQNSGTAPVNGGLDSFSYAYNETSLGQSVTWSGEPFNLGSPGVADAVSSVTIPLPAGSYSSLLFLATGVNTSQIGQVFTVGYTDGTTTSFTQSLSDWGGPQNYTGESIAVSTPARVTSTGALSTTGPWDLYGYSLSLNSAKTVSSITLPNNRNVVVLAITLAPAQLQQTITFPTLPTEVVGTSVTLNATASSGLPVTYTVVPNGNCSVSGSVVTFINGGACGVVAAQSGNATYAAAASVGQVIQVGAQGTTAQSITFPAISAQSANTTLALTATASSGLAVSYASSTTAVCTVSGSTASLLANGTCTITASQAGNTTYAKAAPVSQSFSVGPQSQTITFPTVASQTAGGSVALSATASSSLPVTYTSSNENVCTVSGNVVNLLTGGTCTIVASQAGNSNYNPATSVTQSFTVNLAPQTITFPAPPNAAVGTTYTLNATASSGLAVTYTVVQNGNCSVSGNVVSYLNAGACGITAAQAGNSVYAAATSVGQVVTINAAATTAQTITFPTIANQNAGITITLGATASSGLAVSYTSSTPNVCTVATTTASLLTPGTCTITASQAGNTTYKAATSVTQSFTVGLQSQTITFPAVPNQTLGTPLTLTATASSGLPVTYTAVQNGNCSVSGNVVTFLNVGACGIVAAQAGNSIYAPAPQVGQVITVNAASSTTAQTITFPTIATQTAATTVNLGATASSGLAVSYASSTTGVCTVSGTTASLVTAGTCTITASQPGNSSYKAATSVTQSFTVNLATQTITFPTVPSAYVGRTFTLGATSSSGLTVTYTAVPNGNCSVSGNVVTYLNVGNCGIVAAQAGNATYAVAATVGQVIPVGNAPAPTQVSLSGVGNVYAIFNDGTAPTNGGLDGTGYAYSANYLTTPITYSGSTFTIGAAGTANAVSNKTVTLTSGNFSKLQLLGTSVYGPFTNQSFVVTYSDGTTTTFTQNVSDWGKAQGYTGETVATSEAYRVIPSGATGAGPWNIYGYSFALNNAKTVKSITLPANRDVVVLGLSLVP